MVQTPTNLDYLFIDQIPNFAHLVTVEPQNKEEFLKTIKDTYDLSNVKTNLFYQSCQRSQFETIQLSNDRNSILFNHIY